ncbi:MAG: ABC transporter ATP-binding protein, partial [Dongiaceae bacterium]
MAKTALSLTDVEHAYGETLALRGITLDVIEEEILCLLGPSGCGKTTILRLAAGLEMPRRGTVRVGDRLVTGDGVFVPPEKRDVGLLFQDYALFPHLSVAGNIAFGIRGEPASAQTRRVDELLERTHLTDRRQAYPHTLSGGEQQRVALARALAPGPRVLLLDEPFSGLDTQLRQRVRDETLHVLKEVGAAVVLVTHDSEEALFMADRIALMRAGRIVQVGEPTDLYFGPADAFAAEFFGEVNRIPSRVAGSNVASPFGPLPAGGIADGTPVLCLIRSEALRLHTQPAKGNGPPHAVVEAARLLGRSSLIHLHTHPSTGHALHLHARAMGVNLLRPGTEVWIEVDPRLVFV